ncbi:MAG TPA: DegT/DnrJ/EryC1/StrS family aminotransferase, partial [Chthoniobacterales bacterium]
MNQTSFSIDDPRINLPPNRYSVLQQDAFDLLSLSDKQRSCVPGPEPVIGPLRQRLVQRHTEMPRTRIPVSEPDLSGNERRYVNECIETGWISSAGPFIEKFERAFAKFADTHYAISCSSGTAALHLALKALGVGPGDEVIVPAFTMIAVPNAVVYCGATPVLVDVTPDDYNIDCDLLQDAVTPRTKGVIVVHTYGHPARMRDILRIARRFGLFVLEDAAEAHGAMFEGVRIGSLGTIAAFSFYGNKTLATGEGGMVVCNDQELSTVVRTLRDHAFTPERHFWHNYFGFNYRMTNLQAAVGLAQTERGNQLVRARREVAQLYTALLKDINWLRLPREREGCYSSFWMYAVEVLSNAPASRDDIRRQLAAFGIETRGYFVPIHLQPIYFAANRGVQMPVSE